MARKYPRGYLAAGQADVVLVSINMLSNHDKSLAPTINEQSNPTTSNQEPLQLLQETQLCGATLSVYGTPLEPLFKAKEVAEIIGHSDVSTMMRTVLDGFALFEELLDFGSDDAVKHFMIRTFCQHENSLPKLYFLFCKNVLFVFPTIHKTKT